MNNDFRNKMNEQLDRDVESLRKSSKEIIWSSLDLYQQSESDSSLIWKIISAILLLLFIAGTSYYFHKLRGTSNSVTPTLIAPTSDSLELQQMAKANQELQKAILQLNSEMAVLKEQLSSSVVASAETQYVDHVVYKRDTVLVKADPVTIYKDLIVRDTVYINDLIIEREPVADVQSPFLEEKTKTRRSVQFDLRNQVQSESSKSNEKPKSATYLGIK